VMDLVCDARPLVGDQVVPCRRLRGCDTPPMYDPRVEVAADAAPAVAMAPATPVAPPPAATSVLRKVGPFAVGERFAGRWSVESLSLREDGFVVVLSGEPGRAAFEVTCAPSEHRSPFDLGAAHIFYSSDLEFRSFEDLGWAFQERVRRASRGTDLCDTLAVWRNSAQAG